MGGGAVPRLGAVWGGAVPRLGAVLGEDCN